MYGYYVNHIIGMQFLRTARYTFPMVLTRRIYLKINKLEFVDKR